MQPREVITCASGTSLRGCRLRLAAAGDSATVMCTWPWRDFSRTGLGRGTVGSSAVDVRVESPLLLPTRRDEDELPISLPTHSGLCRRAAPDASSSSWPLRSIPLPQNAAVNPDKQTKRALDECPKLAAPGQC